MERSFPFNCGVTAGVCYYPEHWDRALWREDLRRMLDAGIRVVRVGEFAWSLIEPREGVFDYAFFDAFLDLTDAVGMKVIMGTPTATPPAWLTEKYPEVLNGDINGDLYRHGMRRHYNYRSPVYLEKTRIIVEKAAERYAAHESVIGWQVDNEINCETDLFYSEADDRAFRAWLKEEYGTLDALNAAWGTVFWNETYTSWEEVHQPRPTVQGACNPHLALDWRRCISRGALDYIALQAGILRKYLKKGDFVTTNGLFGHLDYTAALGESLDFITYDNYPNFAYGADSYDPAPDALRDRACVRSLAEIRALSPRFGIMEQQSGANGWTSWMEAPTPREGQIRLWSVASAAHGADFVSWFRWRTCRFSTEMYWHGILDYSGRDNRRLAEVKRTCSEFAALRDLPGTVYRARVGYVKDYDNVWDSESDRWHGHMERESADAVFTACVRSHTPLDHVYLNDDTRPEDLAKYSLLFYPHALLIDEKRVRALTAYVENGGTLVLCARSGLKDMSGCCTDAYLPGLFGDLTGTDIPEYSPARPDETVTALWEDEKLTARVFLEEVESAGAQILARTDRGRGLLALNRVGKGRVYYYGSALTGDTARLFLEKCGEAEPFAGELALPADVECAERAGDGKRFLFLLNWRGGEERVLLKRAFTDAVTGEGLSGELVLEGYGCRILTDGEV